MKTYKLVDVDGVFGVFAGHGEDKYVRAEVAQGLYDALEGIANNRKSVDVPDDEKEEHNYAQGWDAMIDIAKTALAAADKGE